MAATRSRVGDPLDDVLDAVDGDRADRLAGLGQQGGQAGGQRQAPDRREVGARRPRSGRADRWRPSVSCARGGARRRRPRRRPRGRRARRRGRGAAPAASVKRIRYSVNVGVVVADHLPSASQARSSSPAPRRSGPARRGARRRGRCCADRVPRERRRRRRTARRRAVRARRRGRRPGRSGWRGTARSGAPAILAVGHGGHASRRTAGTVPARGHPTR